MWPLALTPGDCLFTGEVTGVARPDRYVLSLPVRRVGDSKVSAPSDLLQSYAAAFQSLQAPKPGAC